ncbi:hypothetical protein CBS101457_000097 [Exobasidium rhododendri]|nr:hypothetical protein CBS101457_000097 [Exobasidium rhododendri]
MVAPSTLTFLAVFSSLYGLSVAIPMFSGEQGFIPGSPRLAPLPEELHTLHVDPYHLPSQYGSQYGIQHGTQYGTAHATDYGQSSGYEDPGHQQVNSSLQTYSNADLPGAYIQPTQYSFHGYGGQQHEPHLSSGAYPSYHHELPTYDPLLQNQLHRDVQVHHHLHPTLWQTGQGLAYPPYSSAQASTASLSDTAYVMTPRPPRITASSSLPQIPHTGEQEAPILYSLVYPSDGSPHEYTIPREYIYPVSRTFPYTTLQDLVFHRLSSTQKTFVVDRILQIRPYFTDSIRKKLARKLTAQLALDILSEDAGKIEAAIDKLYRIDVQKQKSYTDPWMTGLSNAQRRQIIAKFAEVTKQNVDLLREMFLRDNVTPQLALQIRSATDEECMQLAKQNGLLYEENERRAPWQKGATHMQKKALVHRMMATGELRNTQCWALLEKRFVPSGYGLQMLRADDDDFHKMMWMLREYV